MQHRSRSLLAAAVVSALALAACGDDETTESTSAPETTAAVVETTAGVTETTAGEVTETTAGEAATSLAGICPDTVVIQTDWMPEAEHGFLYNLVGDGYEMDADKAYVTGPLVASRSSSPR